MRREWIEMAWVLTPPKSETGLPPCGGSGLKWHSGRKQATDLRLPPCGGSGLKFITSHYREQIPGLPPCGGSGLK